MILSRNMLLKVGESSLSCRTLNCFSEPVSYACVEEDCTGGLITEVFDDSDKVGADVVLHSCPQSCMPNPVEGFLEVYEGLSCAGEVSRRGFIG